MGSQTTKNIETKISKILSFSIRKTYSTIRMVKKNSKLLVKEAYKMIIPTTQKKIWLNWIAM